MALLVTAVGISLLLASRPGQLNPAVVTLAVGSAAALGWTDAYYSLTGIIWPVYLLDGVVQLALLLGWTFSLFMSKRQ